MAGGKKPIIDIDIDPQGKFKNFVGMFEKYQDALKAMPAGWKAVNNEAVAAEGTFERMAAVMLAQNQLARETATAEMQAAEAAERERKQRELSNRSGVLHWRDMARSTRDFAGNILAATTSLLKWSTVTTAVMGLLGAGSLFGIDRLASSVTSGRNTARGLGVSYGENKAFGINFGSVVDSGSYLSAINEDRANFGIGLTRLGLSSKDRSGSNADVGVALLDKFKQFVDKADPKTLGVQMNMFGYDKFFSLEEANKVRAMSPKELDDHKTRYAADAKNLNLPTNTQDAWMRFTQQMSRAGEKLENIGAVFLQKFERPLESLSNSFVKLAGNLAKSPVIEGFMTDLATGLEHFAKYVGSQKFASDVDGFVKDIGDLASGLNKVRKVAGWMFSGVAGVATMSKYTYHEFMGDNNFAVPTRNGELGHAATMRDWFRGERAYSGPLGRTKAFLNPTISSSDGVGAESMAEYMGQNANARQGLSARAQLMNNDTQSFAGDMWSGFKDTILKDLVKAYSKSSEPNPEASSSLSPSFSRGSLEFNGGDLASILSKSIQQTRTVITVNNPAGANVITSTSQLVPQ